MGKPDVAAEVVSQIRRNLVEFGYNGLTDENVATQVAKAQAGEELSIIGMLAKDMLVKNGHWTEE